MLNEQPLFVQPVVKPGCTTVLTTGCTHDTAGSQAGFDNQLNVCIHDTTGCQTGLTTGFLCIQTFNWLSNGFDNRFDNRLYRVNGAWVTYHGYASTHHAQSVYAKFEVSMASPVQLSKVWWGPQNLKLGHHLTLTTPIWYVVVSMLILDMGGLPVTKFENSSFSHYTAMNELTQSLKIGMICDSWGY